MNASRHPVSLLRLLNNLLLVYLLYMLCRVVYICEFWDLYSEGWQRLSIGSLLVGGLRFDTSAILYTNTLYILLVLLPLPRKLTAGHVWRTALKVLYVVVNTLMLVLNLVDTVYSRYSGRRTTWTFFSEFSNEGNLADIVGVEILHHWYLVLIGLAFIAALVLLYRHPYNSPSPRPLRSWQYLLISFGCVLLYAPLAVIGMRGGASTAIRPITISNANQYVNRPDEAAIVLNTPFSLLRTMGKTTFTDPEYFPNDRLDAIYCPLHLPCDAGTDTLTRSPNIVVIILESFGQEYFGAYNDYPGYTPFLDSLIAHSLTFRHSYANGRKSIDGMPSILSGIPMFVEPFFVTGYSLNNVSGIAGELSHQGYTTAFFHGAENGSMGFQAFARTSGFQHYYGRTEYEADSRFGGADDFDGTWAIWDEEFLQFYAQQMSRMPQPFMTAVFTASSHTPFDLPERYKGKFPKGEKEIQESIAYTDYALRRFFQSASHEPWYANTLFVLTADHCSTHIDPYYKTSLGYYNVPIIFYAPGDSTLHGYDTQRIVEQVDIMPTVLSYLHYDKPYLAFGKDMLHTPSDATHALHWVAESSGYEFVRGSYALEFDGEKVTAAYRYRTDSVFAKNVLQSMPADTLTMMTRQMKSIIQQYMQRMNNDQLTIEGEKVRR